MNSPGGNNPSGGKTWPPERIERLKKLWAAGHTAARIAAILGDGITRDSVISAAHRAGCDKRASPITRLSDEERAKRARYRRPHPAAIVIEIKADGSKRRGRPPQDATDRPRACTASPFAPVQAEARNGIRSGQAAAERRLSERAPRRTISLHEPKQANIPDDGRRGVVFADLNPDGCKFAVTPHRVPSHAHRYCNEPRLPGRPYCAAHVEKARKRRRGGARSAGDR